MSCTSPVRPIVAHLVYRFDVGGLENGVVNLLNHLPAARYRHAVIALTEVVPSFAARVKNPNVEFYSLHKPPGQGAKVYPRFATLLRQLKPDLLHTRNLAALEFQLPAWWCGVPARVHGEHGRDVDDPDGTSRRHLWMRRAHRPFVHSYVALSLELAGYLEQRVGVPAARVRRICNGVDTMRFTPAEPPPPYRSPTRCAPPDFPFADPGLFVAGTVGRMQTVKAQPVLARAFVRALELAPALRERLRLVMAGDGSLRAECAAILNGRGVAELAWLPGERSDVAEVMRGLDVFVLPSLAEGISNTILEAMACGLPVLATRVGGNAELVVHGCTGLLVPPADVDTLARSLVDFATGGVDAVAMGRAGRERAERDFSLPAMVRAYQAVYDEALGSRLPRGA